MCYIESTDGMANNRTIYDHVVSLLQTVSKRISQGMPSLLGGYWNTDVYLSGEAAAGRSRMKHLYVTAYVIQAGGREGAGTGNIDYI